MFPINMIYAGHACHIGFIKGLGFRVHHKLTPASQVLL